MTPRRWNVVARDGWTYYARGAHEIRVNPGGVIVLWFERRAWKTYGSVSGAKRAAAAIDGKIERAGVMRR